MKRLCITVALLAMVAGPTAWAADPRVEAELVEGDGAVVPLREALGSEAFEAAMASGEYEYTGNAKCRLCHREFFIGRKKDMHDHTFRRLASTGHADNPECLGCHTTGYGVPTGFTAIQTTPKLANVQCEGCHGPGNRHVLRNDEGGFLAGTDRPEVLEKMCHSCHTERWDRAYHDFDAAYESYKDPQPDYQE